MNLASSSHGMMANKPDNNCDEDENEKSLSEVNKQKEEDVVEMLPPEGCALATQSLSPPVDEEMEEMFLRLNFSQAVAMKLVDEQGIDSPWTLASLSDANIATICNMIDRLGRLVSRTTLNRGNQISLLAMKNLKLMAHV